MTQEVSVQNICIEELLQEYMGKNDAMMQSKAVDLRKLEIQFGKIANETRNNPLLKNIKTLEEEEQCDAGYIWKWI